MPRFRLPPAPTRGVTSQHTNRHFSRIGRRLTAAEAAIDHARCALARLHNATHGAARNTASWLEWQLGLVAEDLRDATDAHDRLVRIAAGESELQDLEHL